MCIIAYTEAGGAIPSREQLQRACQANPDGFGWAIIDNDELIVHHSMLAWDAIESYLETIATATGPSLFHARIASHGVIDEQNCHPFPVDHDPQIVLAHNGILPVYPDPWDARSDTRLFAEEVLPRPGIETLDTALGTWERWMGANNKMVILSVSPRLKKRAYILNASSGVSDGGVWWSNRTYQPFTPTFSSLDSLHLLEEKATTENEWVTCELCRSTVYWDEVEEVGNEVWCQECVDTIGNIKAEPVSSKRSWLPWR